MTCTVIHIHHIAIPGFEPFTGAGIPPSCMIDASFAPVSLTGEELELPSGLYLIFESGLSGSGRYRPTNQRVPDARTQSARGGMRGRALPGGS